MLIRYCFHYQSRCDLSAYPEESVLPGLVHVKIANARKSSWQPQNIRWFFLSRLFATLLHCTVWPLWTSWQKMLQADKVYCRQQSINTKLNNKRKGKHFHEFSAVQRVSGENDGRRMEWMNIVGSYLHIKVVITFGGWAAIVGSVPPQREERSGNSGLVSVLAAVWCWSFVVRCCCCHCS